jgi:hypothetical protein
MKIIVVAGLVTALGLAGCQKAADGPMGGGHAHGRYAGVGLYPADRMWAQVAGAEASKDPAAAKLDDDQEIIVVIDSQTGELRQCGNFSGYCVGMRPWDKPLAAPQAAPLRLSKHAAQLLPDDKASATPSH